MAFTGVIVRIGLVASKPVTIDRFFEDWIHAWTADGHEVHVALEDGEVSESDPTSMIGIKGLRRRPSAAVIRARSELQAWCRDRNLDVVVTNAATPSAVSRLSISDTPVIYFCHGLHWRNSHDWPSYAWSVIEKSLLSRTAGVIFMNGADERWFRRNFRGPMLNLEAGVGLDLQVWKPLTASECPSSISLLWVGEFTTRKRPQDAVAIFRELRARGKATELVMLGRGPLHTEISTTCESEDGIVLAGHTDPIPYFNRASALIHTATWEGFTRVLLESVAMGVPAFGYATKGVLDVPGVAVSGKPGDVRALADLVAHWVDSGCPAPMVNREDLDWQLAYQKVTDFLAQVSGASRSGQ